MNEFTDMLKMQEELNNKTCGVNWRSNKTDKGRVIDWKLCMLMETSELFNSLNWKHWKSINDEDDTKNIKIEIVDIWHFLMSYILQKKTLDSSKVLLETYIVTTKVGKNKQKVLIDFIHLLSDEKEYSLIRYIKGFNDILNVFNMSVKELYQLYIGKNVLNQFRQDNGYAKGRYIKIWGNVEDNIVMMNFIKSDYAINSSKLYKKLQIYYNGVVEGLIK